MGSAQLYLNMSDERVVDKVITAKINYDVFEYKDDTDIIKPSIILANDSRIFECNYVYLSDFRRYYYIRNITVSQQRLRLDLECDPLYTYRAYIRECTGVLNRQENVWSGYLQDAEGFENQYEYTQLKGFTTPFTKSLHLLLTVAG